MSVEDIQKTAETHMAKSMETLKQNLAKIRTGRVHTGSLDHVHVMYHGAPVMLPKLANVNLKDARTLLVQPYDKQTLHAIEKAIRETSGLDLNPVAMGDALRVPMPALTEERRHTLAKLIKSEGEGARIAMRNLRRTANEELKKLLKDKKVSEDEERRAQNTVQKLTDRWVHDIDQLITQKEAEIMKI